MIFKTKKVMMMWLNKSIKTIHQKIFMNSFAGVLADVVNKHNSYRASPTFFAQSCQGSPCGGFTAGFGPVGAGVGAGAGAFCAIFCCTGC
jgi:hypothetical protein